MKLQPKQWKTCLYGHLQYTKKNFCAECWQPLRRAREKRKDYETVI